MWRSSVRLWLEAFIFLIFWAPVYLLHTGPAQGHAHGHTLAPIILLQVLHLHLHLYISTFTLPHLTVWTPRPSSLGPRPAHPSGCCAVSHSSTTAGNPRSGACWSSLAAATETPVDTTDTTPSMSPCLTTAWCNAHGNCDCTTLTLSDTRSQGTRMTDTSHRTGFDRSHTHRPPHPYPCLYYQYYRYPDLHIPHRFVPSNSTSSSNLSHSSLLEYPKPKCSPNSHQQPLFSCCCCLDIHLPIPLYLYLSLLCPLHLEM